MTQAHPSLADQLAALRATVTAAPQDSRHSAIHLTGVWALIAAVLARLLGRLEAMVRLWEAGQFPPPPPRTPSRRPAAQRAAQRAAQPPRQHRGRVRAVLRARAIRSAMPRRARMRAHPRATLRATPNAAAPRTARRKPAARAPPSPHTP